MWVCKWNMRDDEPSPEKLLAELKRLLVSDQLPVQMEIARAAGVHQSFVSRARNGQLKRRTDKVDALLDYARSCVDAEERARVAAQAIDAEADDATSGVAAGPRRTRRKTASLPSDDRAGAEVFRKQAREGVDAYLNEGYDARLIVEQLVVLRRAQRLRRSGPTALTSNVDQVT